MEASSALPCPRCQSPRAAGPECPRCGIIYAKADARAAQQREHEVPPPPEEAPPLVDPAWLATPDLRSDVLPPETPAWDVDAEEAALEHRLRTWALPVALLVAFFAVKGNFSGSLVRLITMPFHELGHAITAWLCGEAALPTLWKTVHFGRAPLLSLLLAAGLGLLVYVNWKRRRWVWVASGAFVLTVQAVCTLLLSARTVDMLIVFNGDAGMMVLGTALMLSFYAPPGSYIHRQALRWGFLPLGALSLMDGFDTWWQSKRNFNAIPFGRSEGIGLSDASRLSGTHQWGDEQLVRRFLMVGVLCLVCVAVVYAVMFIRGRARLTAR
ncbi:hypothetical protein [Comamonas sp. JC664]|uniref:hypothetical protein n=1 Tax=Comamonas sp. JC664 TaxID=2801917 RepID=UPI0017486167|nr:hypothetical protein [Comamonas sp. JC664]MBL0693196.1 hypothetical protein [Comamonas sp. JC664]GHG97307.1 hypothetical protein GCM10012319_62170 [Comamonas sp. KCTC 72670]